MTTVLNPPILNKDQRDAIKDPLDRRDPLNLPEAHNLFITEFDAARLESTLKDSWTVGTTTDDYIYFFANTTGTSANPSLRYNKIKLRWEFNNGDGVFYPIGTGGAIAGSKSYIHTQINPSTSWNVQHLLKAGVVYNITDSENSVIQPDEVKIVDSNSLIVTFDTPVSGFMYVLSSEYDFEQLSLSQTWTVPHSLNTHQVACKVFDWQKYEIQPDQVTIDGNSNIQLTFNAETVGSVYVVGVGMEHLNDSAAAWNVVHNLSTRTLVFTITDALGNQIMADSVVLTNSNTLDITFLENVAGSVEVIEG